MDEFLDRRPDGVLRPPPPLAPARPTPHADLRLSLVGLVGVVARRGDCPEIMDAAVDAAVGLARDAVAAAGAGDPVAARFAAARLLNSLCASCGACPRGRIKDEVTPRLP